MKEKVRQAYYFNEQFEKIRFSCLLDKEKKNLITKNKLRFNVLNIVIGNKMYSAVYNGNDGVYHYLVKEVDPHKIYALVQCLQRKVAYSVKQGEIVMIEPKLNGNEKKIAYYMLDTVCEDEEELE